MATEVHSASSVNGVSILLGSTAPPQPIKSAPAPAGSQPPGEATFRGQLKATIQEREGEAKDTNQGSRSDDAKRDTAKKKDGAPQTTILVATPQAPLPAAPLAAFGLPAAGVEPGPDANDKSEIQPSADAISTLTSTICATLPPATNLPIDFAQKPADTSKPEPKTDIAFALRLADVSPNRQTEPEPQTRQGQVQQHTEAASQAAPIPSAPQISDLSAAPMIESSLAASSGVAFQQIKGAPTGATAQTPAVFRPAAPILVPGASTTGVVSSSEKYRGSAHGGGSSSSGNGAADKEAPKMPPKSGQTQAAVESRFPRQSMATFETTINTAKNAPPESSSLATLVAAPAPAPLSTPLPSSNETATDSAQPITEAPAAPVTPTSTSQVTDLSVTVPIPRPDAASDERVSIRMVQKGADIHVSVRTPDTQLAQSLRQDLGKLSTGLDQAGFRTEAWRPTAVAAGASTQSNSNPQREPSQGGPNQDWNGQNARSGDQGGRGSQDQRRKQQDDRPRWVMELEQQQNQ